MQRLSLPRHETRKPDFSLAMVNIVLLLVLFFIVVGAPADPAERDIRLPEVRDLPIEALPRPLLRLTSGDGLVLDGQIVARTALISAIRQGDGPQMLHLLVARDHAARAVLALSAELGAAGAQVKLVTVRSGPDGGGAP
ncbi:hypothetical protein ROE7235_02092 [Roseibaca ekhonensis]|uniref:Biopolymer transport protein ExbD n=1 Tax=Roseinatronobacter ekhonensis TaxID=254356 RepID=A0A3B0MX00_9RHOB|nr:hypothetical protein [Roseibaca ekhonensis]SUZ32336.1 hypothetical protein ROE7235_02092 [Roseibaca ekhonensis]